MLVNKFISCIFFWEFWWTFMTNIWLEMMSNSIRKLSKPKHFRLRRSRPKAGRTKRIFKRRQFFLNHKNLGRQKKQHKKHCYIWAGTESSAGMYLFLSFRNSIQWLSCHKRFAKISHIFLINQLIVHFNFLAIIFTQHGRNMSQM